MAYYGSPAAPAVDPAALGGMTPQEEFEMQMRILGEEQRRKQRLLGGDFRAGGVYPSFADAPGPINQPDPFPLTWGGRQISREEFQKFGGAAGFDPRNKAQAAAQQEARLAQDEAQWRRGQEEGSVARAYTPTKRGVYSPGAPGQTIPARHQLEEYRGARVSDREAAKEQLKRGDVERLRPGIMRGVEIGLAPWQQLRDTPSGRFVDRKPHAQIVGDRPKSEGYDAQMAANRKRYYARQENRKQLRREVLRERSKGIRRGEAWGAMRDSYTRAPSEGYMGRANWRAGRSADKTRTAHADKLAVKYGHKDWSAWAAAGGPTQAERNEIRVANPVATAKEELKRWRQSPTVQSAFRERADYKRQPYKASIGEQQAFKMPTLTQITEMAKKEKRQGRWVPRKGFVGETRKDVFKRLYDRFDSRRRQLGVEEAGFSRERNKLQKLQENYKEAYRNEDFLKNVLESKTRRKGEWEAREAAEEEVLSATPTPAEVIPGIHAEGKEPPLTETKAEFHTTGGMIGRPKTGTGLGAPEGIPDPVPGYGSEAIGSLRGANIEIRELAGTLRTPQYGTPGPSGVSFGGSWDPYSVARERKNTYTAIETSVQKEMDATAGKFGASSIPTEAIRMSVGDKRIRKYLVAARRRVLKPLRAQVRTGTLAEKEAAQKAITRQVNRWKQDYMKAKVEYTEV